MRKACGAWATMDNTVSRRFGCIITQILRSPKNGQKVRITMTNTINAGKVNFNVKTAKVFRDTMGVYHVFKFELADLRKKKVRNVAMYKRIIATDEEYIEKKNYRLHDKKFYEDEIVAMQGKIADAEKELADWIAEEEANGLKAEAIFTRDMYKKYVASMHDNVNEWRVSNYTQALADMLTANGVTPAWDTLNVLYHLNRERVGTGSDFAETGMHMTANKEKAWRDALMGKLCDLMGGLLPTYKFVNILTKAERKAQKAQNK